MWTFRIAALSLQKTELCNTHSDTIAQTPVIFLKDTETAHITSHPPSLNVVGYTLTLTEIHYTNSHGPLVMAELCNTDQFSQPRLPSQGTAGVCKVMCGTV